MGRKDKEGYAEPKREEKVKIRRMKWNPEESEMEKLTGAK